MARAATKDHGPAPLKRGSSSKIRPLPQRDSISATIVDELPKAASSEELVAWCLELAGRLDQEQQQQADPSADPSAEGVVEDLSSDLADLEEQVSILTKNRDLLADRLRICEDALMPLLRLKAAATAIACDPSVAAGLTTQQLIELLRRHL